MKILKLKEELEKKYQSSFLKTNYIENDNCKKHMCRKNKELKIIGITGSVGKSTTAFIVHKYLKSLGYKSVLYSSLKIDSPASIISSKDACEISFSSEKRLFDIINEIEAYGADYLVLEVNDSTLEKGFLKDIDFDVRVLTNLNPLHNLEHYSKEEYVNLKKSFFKNINEDSKCVIGLQDYDKELFKELLNLNNNPKYIFTSEYIANVKNVDKEYINCLLTNFTSTLDGVIFNVILNNEMYEFKSKLIMTYNIINFLDAITILYALGVFNSLKFQECIYNINIPGRAEVFKANNRLIIIDAHLPKMLECLKELKNKNQIKEIKVVLGAIGNGFKTWDERFNKKQYNDIHKQNKKYAMELLKKYADYAYLTENDNASQSVLEICRELKGYLEDVIPATIIEDREEAIRKAILESNPYDVIFISGRGNRRILCTTKDRMKLVKDEDVVKKVLKDLNWI